MNAFICLFIYLLIYYAVKTSEHSIRLLTGCLAMNSYLARNPVLIPAALEMKTTRMADDRSSDKCGPGKNLLQ